MRSRTPAYVAAALVLAYASFLAARSAGGFPERLQHGRHVPYLSDKPLGEDAYYMIAIGWNLGNGQGLSYGGQPTTGTQPLMTLAYGALASVVHATGGDRWTFARAALALNGALFVAFWPIAYGTARALSPSSDRDATAAAAAALTLFNYTLFRLFTYGLETRLYLLLAGSCVLLSIRVLRRTPSLADVVPLGLAAGIAALARIDFLLVFALFMGLAALGGRVAFSRVLAAGLAAGAIVLPWFAYVHQVSGRWMPTSGESQSRLIDAASATTRLHAVVAAIAHHLSPWFYPELVTSMRPRGVVLAASAALIAAAVPFLVRARKVADDNAWNTVELWAAAILALVAVYVVCFWPTYFYLRYSALAAVLTIPALAVGLASLAGARWRTAILPAAAAAFAVTALVTLHRGMAGNSLSVTSEFIDRHVPRDARVGAFSSGVSGYFFDNVTNLDGKVNAAAMRARRDGRLGRYINESGISILIDWPETMRQFVDPAYIDACWQPCGLPMLPEQGRCFVRRPCDASRW